jgi:hypothetical protein
MAWIGPRSIRHWCLPFPALVTSARESDPFYRQLAGARESTQLIAVLPQPVKEGRQYVDGFGFEVNDVVQAPLNSINVSGTPTLLLVNRNGM